jgi:hypothetical protein
MREPTEIVDRYIAFWNEPDPDRRRAAIEDLWAEDGAHLLEPPEDVAAIVSRPGVGLTARLEARGHDELVAPEGEAIGAGHDFLVLSAEGRILRDYQFRGVVERS